MSETSYNVQVWKIEVRKNAAGKITSYRTRWRVEDQDYRKAFKTSAHAESFRSELLTAARKGEAFLVESPGLPISMVRRNKNTRSWFDFACDYVDMKWPHTSPGQRRSTADSLVAITNALWTNEDGRPDQRVVNRALRTAFSFTARDGEHPAEIHRALRWISGHTRQTGELASPDLLRELLAALDRNQSGERAAPDTVRLRRTTLRNALDYAVEKKLLDKNPMLELKVKRQATTVKQVDRRSVVNPTQARALLRAVRARNPRLEAFFGLLYFAALRPEEATNFRQGDMALAADGWGELHLSKATPEIAEVWTDSGARSEARNLKHRADRAGRTVPCPPELADLLRRHIEEYGVTRDGRLFAGTRNEGRLSSTVYGRAWAQARAEALPKEAQATPLAKRPYDLRHAAVSTWLNAGVEPTRVAEWAGHSVHVLLRVYAKCLDGGERAARDRVQQALEG